MTTVQMISCASCGWRYLPGKPGEFSECPNCRREDLHAIEGGEAYEPELCLPFSVDPDEFAVRITEFAGRIPYPPEDLSPGRLIRRARRVYVPQFLVDASVEGRWKAEMGFDYQVVSHQEHLAGRSWQSEAREETRTRWEPRVGMLAREYHNVSAPALEDDRTLMRRLGAYSMADAEPAVELEPEAFVRLPDRATSDAWLDAVPGFLAKGMEECRLASGADHVRSFAWDAVYTGQNWTQLLLPVITTYYVDDESQHYRLLMNGQTGALSGTRRASMKRAQAASLRILIAALVVFFLGLAGLLAGAVFPPVLVLGTLALGAAFVIGLGAVVPIFRVWRFNRQM